MSRNKETRSLPSYAARVDDSGNVSHSWKKDSSGKSVRTANSAYNDSNNSSSSAYSNPYNQSRGSSSSGGSSSNNYSSGSSSSVNNVIAPPPRKTSGDSYNWRDPNDYTHVTMELPNGKTTTVHRNQADKFANMGYKMGSPTQGASRWNKEMGIRNDTAGSDWVDDGYNSGNIRMATPDGRHSSVNAVYADKYFDQGYTLDSRSQSINRALQSGKHQVKLRQDEAIRGGVYDPNHNYSADGGWDDNANNGAGGYAFDGGDGRSGWDSFGDAIDRKLNPDGTKFDPYGESSISSDVGSNLGEATNVESASYEAPEGAIKFAEGIYLEDTDKSANIRIMNINGERVKMSENEYVDSMLHSIGLEPLNRANDEGPEGTEVQGRKDMPEEFAKADAKVAEEAERKAIAAKLEAEKQKHKTAPSGKVNNFIDEARKMTGWSYSQPKRNSKGYVDCSSLVGRAMKNAGLTDKSHVTTASMTTDKRFTKISKAEAKPGDIMWQKGHVAIFLGNNKVLEASGSKKKVIEQNLNNRFAHAYRINV